MFTRIERLNIPHEAGAVSSSFWLILVAERKIIRLGEWLPVSPCLHPAASRHSHKDQMVWGGLRFDETPLSVVEDALPELRDND